VDGKANGDLLTYIKRNEGITMRQKVQWFADISSGMHYLASKKIYHRDLAARNCLLDANLTVNVADFGLSTYTDGAKDHHISRAKSLLQKVPQPLWWMAPECFESRLYNEKTDVWSFGIVIWEVMSNGETPYSTYRWKGEQLFIAQLKRGLQPDKLLTCPDIIRKIMSLCLTILGSQRPDFYTLEEGFNEILSGR